MRRLLALVALLGLLLGACAGADDDSSGTFDETSEALGDAATDDGGNDEGGDGGSDATSGDVNLAPADTLAADGAEASLAAESPERTLAGGGDGSLPTQAPDIETFTFGRDIIFTADLVLLVDDVAGATERAGVAVGSVGGVVFGQNSQSDPEARTTVTFKVPPEEFQNALSRLGALGTVESQTVSAEDVTDRVVDLESRIQTAQASVDRLRGFLAGADDLATISQLEAQLLERETLLEQLRGQVRTLENQVGLATIVVTISQAPPPELDAGFDVAVTAYQGHDAGEGCPGDDDLEIDEDEAMTVCWSVHNTGEAHLGEITVRDDRLGVDMAQVEAVHPDDSLPGFVDSLRASADVLAFLGSILVLILGAIVPLLPVLVVGGALVWWLRRRPQTGG